MTSKTINIVGKRNQDKIKSIENPDFVIERSKIKKWDKEILEEYESYDKQLQVIKQLYMNDETFIYKNVVKIGGAGGCGKTYGCLNYFENYKTAYVSFCWNLIQQKQTEYPDIIGLSINKLIGKHKVNRLMVGNVMTADGIHLYEYFAKYIPEIIIRVGIAGGSACATSDATGYNRGQITEIIECSGQADIDSLFIAADGGIKNGNYAAKAFGAGADYVMMGGYFARAKEAYTWENGDGTYWGGASTKQQQLYGGVRRHSEGKVYEVDRNSVKPLNELVDDLWGGLSSAVSYSGYKSLTDFIGNGIFEIKENSLPPGR